MKEWEELENNFLEEVEPLISEFFENKKTDVEDKKEQNRLYKIRLEIRKKIGSKLKPFVKEYRKMVNGEIETLTEEAKQIREWVPQEVESLKQLYNEIIKIGEAKQHTKDEDTYQLLSFSEEQKKEEYKKRQQECIIKIKKFKSNFEEIKRLREMLKEQFEIKYRNMALLVTENDMQTLDVFISLKEEKIDNRILEGEVYYANEDVHREIETIGEFIDIQEEAIEEKRKEEREEIAEAKRREREEIKERTYREIVGPLAQKAREELDQFIDEKMREIMEMDNEEITVEETKTSEKEKEDDDDKNRPGGTPKKEKITLLQRFTSIFRKRNIPRLGEGEPKQQVTGKSNKFVESIKKGAPPQKQQANNSRNFIGKNKEEAIEEKDELEEMFNILFE